MQQDIDKARRQIRALLNLGADDGATQAEAENALRFARRLMLQHNVDEADVTAKDAHELEADAERVAYGKDSGYTVGKDLTGWEASLLHAIAALVGTVKSYYRAGQYRRTGAGVIERFPDGNPKLVAEVTFFGPEEDARDAVALFEEWSLTIAALARMKFNGALRGPGRNYAEGFVAGLHERLREMRKQEVAQITSGHVANGCTALVVQNATALMAAKQAKALQWLAGQGVKLRKGGARSGGAYDGDARAAGEADGRKASFTRERKARLGDGS